MKLFRYYEKCECGCEEKIIVQNKRSTIAKGYCKKCHKYMGDLTEAGKRSTFAKEKKDVKNVKK